MATRPVTTHFNFEPKAEDVALMKAQSWREPSGSYVVLKKKRVLILPPGTPPQEGDYEGLRPELHLVTITMEGCHKQPSKILRLMEKWNAEIVTWGRFPEPGEKKAKMLSAGTEGTDPWSELDTWLRAKVGASVDARLTVMQSKISEQNKEIAELRAKLEGKTDADQSEGQREEQSVSSVPGACSKGSKSAK